MPSPKNTSKAQPVFETTTKSHEPVDDDDDDDDGWGLNEKPANNTTSSGPGVAPSQPADVDADDDMADVRRHYYNRVIVQLSRMCIISYYVIVCINHSSM